MSRVVFQLDFTVEGKNQLVARASISHTEAVRIEGLMGTSEDTIIRIFDPKFEQPEKSVGKGNRGSKGGLKSKAADQMQIEVAPLSVNDEKQQDDEDEIGEADMKELQCIEMEMQDRMIEDQMNGEEEDDDDNLNPDDELDLSDEADNSDQMASPTVEDQIVMKFHQKKMTKRQLGFLQQPMELPNKISRQRKKQEITAEEDTLKRLEKDDRRRQYMKKQIEAQKMETLDKILNETGRKQRQRNERENKQRNQKENKTYKSLGDTPKLILKWTPDGCSVETYKTLVFHPEVTVPPRIPMKPQCYLCGGHGRYKVSNKQTVCSLTCYKRHNQQIPVTSH